MSGPWGLGPLSVDFFCLDIVLHGLICSSNKVRLSPHQIAFHVKHPNNTFILVKALGLNSIKLYEGKVIKELDACGLRLNACALGLEACCLRLAAC